ncbi:hypothetical protein D9619_006226 [Psilocybe cf. subviscida]|uniref:Phosphoribosyltransferase domain-containing protein n=1 Tax=Psilocybe cf. subviscida TaxID=2480587 RepID=A0A8H5B4Y1_9AGAR|nr:hypothetical protein D9619_006226 [Psilocybe cf. subviscida]
MTAGRNATASPLQFCDLILYIIALLIVDIETIVRMYSSTMPNSLIIFIFPTSFTMADEVQHFHVTYNDIHNLIRTSTPQIITDFDPDLLVAIGGGGFFPARVMVRGCLPTTDLAIRTFLRSNSSKKAIQIQAIGLSLYEPVEGMTSEQIGHEVIRTQWLGPHSGKLLLGKHNLIVDEVDDTRKTLHYALSELQKDVEEELLAYPEEQRAALRAATKFGIFVVHNKLKPKLAELPAGTPYFSGQDVDDVWLDYPWESINIEEHDKQAAVSKAGALKKCFSSPSALYIAA